MRLSKQAILCVDNKDNLNLIKFVFESEGFEVTTCDSLESCLSQIRQNRFAAVILNNRFGGRTSAGVCREIRCFNPIIPIVFYSGEARRSEIEKAIQAGGNAYLVKPLDFDKLIDTVNKLIAGSSSGFIMNHNGTAKLTCNNTTP